MTTKENPAPRANAGNRANKMSLKQGLLPRNRSHRQISLTAYIANRFHLPLPVAALVARLAKLAEVLS